MIWLLLVIYQIKHFVCDYPLQSKYMLGKFKEWPDFFKPLLAHSLVHGLATFLIALCVNPKLAIWVDLFDVKIHFIVDRVKASPKLLGRFKALSAKEYGNILSYQCDQATMDRVDAGRIKSNTYFWWALGADQMAHHLTHYVIIFFLLRGSQ